MNALVDTKRSIRDRTDLVIQPIMQEIAGGLPATITPERFQAAAVTAFAANPDIFKCDPQSIRTALMKCAADGLVPDGRQAALVPFKGFCQYMPMVQGIIKRARELGEIDSIKAHPVYSGDHFVWHQGDDDRIEHTPASLGSDRGAIIGAYAIFTVSGVVIHREVMSKAEIDKTRAVSKATNSPAWNSWYSEMARKAVIRRGSKYVPMSDSLRRLVEREDEHVDFALVDQRTSAAETIAARLRASQPQQEAIGTAIVDHVAAELSGNSGEVEEAESGDDIAPESPLSFAISRLNACESVEAVEAAWKGLKTFRQYATDDERKAVTEAASAKKRALVEAASAEKPADDGWGEDDFPGDRS